MQRGAEILLPQGVTRPDFVARPHPEAENPPIIYYAGKSLKRIAFLQRMAAAQGKILLSVGGGLEDNDLKPEQIATGKIEHALALLGKSGEIDLNSRTKIILIAADVQVHSPTLKPDGKTASRASGKLKELYEVRHVFQGMTDSARTIGDKRDHRYLIEAGSESRTMVGAQIIETKKDTNYFHIALEQQAVAFFATPEGAEQYLDELSRFLRSPQYLSNGVEEPGSPTEISGGLDLAVLKKLGAVRKINQTPRESPDFERVFGSAIFAAYIGFDASVLEQISPNAQQLIDQWPWLQKVTDYAMNFD